MVSYDILNRWFRLGHIELIQELLTYSEHLEQIQTNIPEDPEKITITELIQTPVIETELTEPIDEADLLRLICRSDAWDGIGGSIFGVKIHNTLSLIESYGRYRVTLAVFEGDNEFRLYSGMVSIVATMNQNSR